MIARKYSFVIFITRITDSPNKQIQSLEFGGEPFGVQFLGCFDQNSNRKWPGSDSIWEIRLQLLNRTGDRNSL